jgi:hypothetical protein
MSRSSEEIQKEYNQACAQIGHLQYQITVLNSEIAAQLERAKVLNQENIALNEKSKADSESV